MLGVFRRTSKIRLVELCFRVQLFNCLSKIRKMPFYAVAKGRNTGIYHSWADCEAQVKGFSGAKFKKFDTASSANEFINSNSGDDGNSENRTNNYNYQANSNYTVKRSYATSSKNNVYDENNDSSFNNVSVSSGDELDVIITKQMDDLEKRVNNFSKGIDKIKKSANKISILIEPPQPKRYKRSDDFEEDEEGYVQVYTDGACSDNGKEGARAGLGVYWGDEHPLNMSEPVSGRATNNCGEIQAAMLAIKTAHENGVKKLAINTDSRFLIKAATEWIPGWKRKGWKLVSGGPVKNQVDFKELDSLMDKVEIKWNYVKAHNGQHGNEMADRLAKAGAAMYVKGI